MVRKTSPWFLVSAGNAEWSVDVTRRCNGQASKRGQNDVSFQNAESSVNNFIRGALLLSASRLFRTASKRTGELIVLREHRDADNDAKDDEKRQVDVKEAYAAV